MKLPKSCPKCGYSDRDLTVTGTWWDGPKYDGMSGMLMYWCGRCGYWWRGLPKDQENVDARTAHQ